MTKSEDFFDRALEIVKYNESVYNKNEYGIASCMAKKWPDAFQEAAENIGCGTQPTTLEVADVGRDGISNKDEFLEDLRYILKRLTKSGSLDANGDWC